MKIVKYPQTLKKNFTGVYINYQNAKFWYKNDRLHRKTGPAIMRPAIIPYVTILNSWWLFYELKFDIKI